MTEGLLRALSWDEIRGVLAYERNRGILFGAVAATIATTISCAVPGSRPAGADRGQLAPRPSARAGSTKPPAPPAGLIGDGESQARALEKVNGYSLQIRSSVPPPQASHYIVNPLANRQASLANPFAIHPRPRSGSAGSAAASGGS